MRIALHEEAVLVGAGLGLVAVDDEVARPHAGRAEAPLDAGGEAGAAAAEQAGRLHLVDDRVGRLAERPCAGRRSRRWPRSARACAVVVAEAAGDDLRGVGDRSSGRLGRRRSARWRAIHTGSVALVGTDGAGGPVGRDAAGGPGRACRAAGTSSAQPAGAEVVDQLVELVVGDAVEVAVVHLEARRLGARRDALDVLEREQAVGGGAARP